MSPDPGEHDPTGDDLARQIARSVRGGPVRTSGKAKRSGPKTSQELTPVGEVLSELILEQGWSTQVNIHQLLARWPVLVGPANAEHSTPESFSDSVLTVRAESSVWATSLRTIAPQLVAVLNEQLGQGTVSRVVVVGPQAPSWKKGRRSVPGRGPRDTYG